MLNKTSLKPSNILSRSFAIFSLMLLTSCLGSLDSLSSKLFGNKSGNQETEIRIVDLNGNPKPIRRMVPEGNAQILASQREEAAKNNIAAINNANSSKNNSAPQNYQRPRTEQITSNNIKAPATNNANAIKSKPIEAVVSYDMADEKAPKIKTGTIQTLPQTPTPNKSPNKSPNKRFRLAVSKTRDGNVKAKSLNKSGILIQIGSFSSPSNADRALEQGKKISAGKIEEVNLKGRKNYRVFLGPISNSKTARNILKKAKNSGYKDAFIVR